MGSIVLRDLMGGVALLLWGLPLLVITSDALSDLKRIHSHICSVAYPVLEAAGELGRERLPSSMPAVGNNASDLKAVPPGTR